MANMTTQEILQGIKDWAAPKVIYDISAAHNNTKYTDLSDALGTGGNNIPQEYRKGGITVRYVRSSDNKYVQYRLMADGFTTDTTQWAVADEGVYVENPEFAYVKTDKEGKILWAIRTDGDIFYGVGVPQQVVDYINEKIAELSLDEYEDIVAFLNDLEKGDKTLQGLLNEKVDKEEGKSLIDAEYAEGVHYVENPEFVRVVTDNEDRILYAVKADGDFYFGAGVPQQIIDYVIEHTNATKEELLALIDTTKVDKEDGKSLIDEDYANGVHYVENPEFAAVWLDNSNHILYALQKDGKFYFGCGIPQQIVNFVNSIKTELLDVINSKVDKVEGKSLSTNDYTNDDKKIVNNINDYTVHFASLKRTILNLTTGQPTTDYNTLTLGVITDTHQNISNIQYFINIWQKYKTYIDDAIHIGDYAPTYWSNYNEIAHDGISHFNEILKVIGNHDVYGYPDITTDYSHYFAPDSAKYARYMKNISNWGVVQPQGVDDVNSEYYCACYYYKDYPSSKIRLVVLDCMHWTNAQKSWFMDVLDDARLNNYHVIIAQHVPQSADGYNGFDSIWNDEEEITFIREQYNEEIITIVDNFIQQDGVFICYLFGHIHRDLCGTLINHPNQLYIAVAASNAMNGVWQGTVRIAGTDSEFVNSFISIEPHLKLIRLFRIGSRIDRNIQKKEVLCIDYNNKNIKYNY